MTNDLLLNFLAGLNLFAVLFLVTALIYLIKLYQHRRHRQFSEEEVRIVEAESKSSSILHQAIKQGQKMIVRAELEGISLIAKLKIRISKLEEEQHQQMKIIMEEMRDRTEKESAVAGKTYEAYLKTLQSRLEEDLSQKQEVMKAKVDQMFSETQNLLNNFISNLQKQTEVQISQEIGQARHLIDEYRRKRLEIVDENIVAILERTLSVTLGKKLSLTDQTQLVYEALEEAKKENIFV